MDVKSVDVEVEDNPKPSPKSVKGEKWDSEMQEFVDRIVAAMGGQVANLVSAAISKTGTFVATQLSGQISKGVLEAFCNTPIKIKINKPTRGTKAKKILVECTVLQLLIDTLEQVALLQKAMEDVTDKLDTYEPEDEEEEEDYDDEEEDDEDEDD